MYLIKDYLKNMEVYLGELKTSRNLDDKTIKAYTSDLSLFQTWLNDNGMKSIDSTTINKYIEYLQNNKKLKDTSIKRKFISLKAFFSYSYNDTIIFKNIKFKSEKKLPKTIPITDIVKVLKSLEVELSNSESEFHKRICIRDNAIIELLFCTGIRIGELSKIRMDDIDFNTKTVLIQGKGRKVRMLFISSEQVLVKLKQWIDVRDKFSPNCDYFFVNKYGNQISIYAIENIFYKYRDIAEINKKSTPHFLRHTYATTLYYAKIDIKTAQRLLGHATIQMTMDIYTHLEEDNIDVEDKLNEFLSPEDNPIKPKKIGNLSD